MRRRSVLAALATGIGGCLSGDSTGPATERGTGPAADPVSDTASSRTGTATATASPESPVDRTYDENVASTVREYPLVRAVTVERGHDDNWWVLEVSMEYDGLAAVYEYTPEWEPAGEATAFELVPEDREWGVVPTDVSPRPDGGWFVLGEDHTVYVVDSDWNLTGESTDLPKESDWTANYRSFAFERASDGWWTFAYGRLTLYDPDFEEITASYHAARDLDLGEEYYNEHYGNLPVSKIRTVHLTPDDTLVLRANISEKFFVYADPGDSGLDSTTPTETFTPDTNPDSGYGLASEADGDRYVLQGKGQLYRYTSDWTYAGDRYRIGSGDAYNRYPPDAE